MGSLPAGLVTTPDSIPMKSTNMAKEAQQQTTHSYRRNQDVTFDSLIAGWEGCTVVQAYDELNREMNVREKCFSKWVGEGKLSASDAADRAQRMAKACRILAAIAEDDGLANLLQTHMDQSETPASAMPDAAQ
jgi:hypothetical protein